MIAAKTNGAAITTATTAAVRMRACVCIYAQRRNNARL